MKFKMAIVEWEDASHYSSEDISWLKQNASAMRNRTIGFIITKTKKKIVLAAELGFISTKARDATVIPLTYVKKVIYLEKEKEVKDKSILRA